MELSYRLPVEAEEKRKTPIVVGGVSAEIQSNHLPQGNAQRYR
jgi:hypothetical protein